MKKMNGKWWIARTALGTAVWAGVLLGLAPMAGAGSASEPSYVALGDSISSGYGLEEASLGFPHLVARDNGLELTNLAQVGETSASLLDKLNTPQVAEAVAQAEVITITVGGNDVVNALYDYLAEEHNQLDPDDPTSEEAVKTAVMGGDVAALSFAIGVGPDFPASQQAAQALEAFEDNLTQIVTQIYAANGDVRLVVVEQYDPYGYLVKSLSQNPLFAGPAQSMSQAFRAGVTELDETVDRLGQQLGYSVAEVYDAFDQAQENPCNAALSGKMGLNLDFHPNAYGHTLIAGQVTAKLSQMSADESGEKGSIGTEVAADLTTPETGEDDQPPRTGDAGDLAAWGLALGLSAAGLVGVTGWQRARREKRD